jgi:RNA polymerase sigma-70 factor, ECF subfamily
MIESTNDVLAIKPSAGDGPDPSCDSTLDVLERARRGDRSAAQVLIARAVPPLRRWSRGRVPHYARGTADTEDVVQDAVLGTFKRIERFEHRTVGALQAYLREAVMNRIRDLIRSSRRRGITVELKDDLPVQDLSPLEVAIRAEKSERFLKALQALSPADRQVIVWRIELGYTVSEISERLGKSKAAAGMTVSRALQRLSKVLHLSN